MPISVQCRCGKAFNVRDELAGTVVDCGVCGGKVGVPRAAEEVFLLDDEPGTAVISAPPPLPSAPSSAEGPTMVCPACAETIPASSVRCPQCRESLHRYLTPEKEEALISAMLSELAGHLADPAAMEADERMRGPGRSPLTIPLAVLAAVSIAVFAIGVTRASVNEALTVLSFLSALICVPLSLYSVIHNHFAAKVTNAPDAPTAFRRYLSAIMKGRYGRAYAALVPTARTAGGGEPVHFSTIPANMGEYPFSDQESFSAYWKSIHKGPKGNIRQLSIGRVKLVAESQDFCVIEAPVSFTSYPTWLLLTLLLGLLPGLVVLIMVQKQEIKTIRKLIVRRDSRFFIAEGEFVGPLDGIGWAAGAPGR